ncbi:MAG: TIGR02302 family protein [Pseudomonadota bacterium]
MLGLCSEKKRIFILNTQWRNRHTGDLVHLSAWVSLAWEKLWPLLVPLVMTVCAFLAFSWAGGWHYLQISGQEVILWIARLGFAASLAWSLSLLRFFSLPKPDDITRRIETRSGLENRPITAQTDPIAMGGSDRFSQALWQEHQTRMANRLENLTSGSPSPKADRFDPFAVRAMLPLLAFAAFFFSFSPQGGRIADVYQVRSAEAVIPTRIDAWINPPAYTRKSPIYLTLAENPEDTRVISAPEGSEFFLRFIGTEQVELVIEGAQTEQAIPPKEVEEGKIDREFSFSLNEDQVVKLKSGSQLLSQWGVTLVPDLPPEIAFFEHPSAALSGSMELTYTVQDDYGVVEGRAIIEPVEEQDPNARALIGPPDVKLPLPRTRAKKGVSKLNKDLTEHPWAGSRVKITLEVKDDLGQTGQTETREITLPGRRFSQPLAQALVEQRRILAMDANRKLYVANLLDAVSTAPEEFIDNSSALIGMRVAYRRILDSTDDDGLRDALDLLWDIALAVEFGDMSEAERRLREAQEALSEALENNASQEEIDRLMEELRQAMNEMMQALAEQARNNPQSDNPFDPGDAQMLTQNDLERMMDRIEDLAKSGSQDAARQMLSELQRMMDNLRAGRHEQQRQAEGNQLNQALDKLSELMQQQQQLLNETYRMQRQQEQGLRPNQEQNQQQGQQRQGNQQQGQRQGNQQGDPNQQGQQGGQMTEQELADALKRLQEQQEALERQLGELGQQLEELGLGQPQELGEAQREMGEAGENLGQGNTPGAATDQGQALEALRQGAQNMMQQMAGDRQQGGQQQSQNGGQGQTGGRRTTDPLGRENGDGLDAASDVEIPGEIDAQRARRILEAIRERLAIPENPLIEKDYLERLLRSE